MGTIQVKHKEKNGMDIMNEALSIKEEMIGHYRYLHKNAEVGEKLPLTKEYIKSKLEEIGLSPKTCGESGIFAVIGEGEKCVLIRADMDALTIKEETGLKYKCKSGCMHACGHDMHASMLLGASKILKAREENLKMPVKVVFQGAEEQLRGMKDMINNGILEEPRVVSAGMIHTMIGENLDTGTVILPRSGEISPCADMFEVTVYGKGAHGAMARLGVDTVNVISHIVIALQAITSREIGLNEPAALTVGAIKCGEEANVIAEKGILKGSVRSYSSSQQEYLKKRISQICKQTSATFKARCTVRFTGGAPGLLNDTGLVECAREVLSRELGGRLISGGESKSTGSEDFAHITHRVPSLMLALCAGNKDSGYAYPLHHPKAIFDTDAMTTGAFLYSKMALDILPGVTD